MPARLILFAALAFGVSALLPQQADAAQRKAAVTKKQAAQTTVVSTSREEKVCIQ